MLTVFQETKLVDGRSATTAFSKQIGISLGIGGKLLIFALFVEAPSLTDIRETQHALVLTIAKQKSPGISHTSPIGSEHISDAAPIALNINRLGQLYLIDGNRLTVRQRYSAYAKGLFGQFPTDFNGLRATIKNDTTQEDVVKNGLPVFAFVWCFKNIFVVHSD
ncbi:MAG: hypothetical protein SOV62_03795 [Alloprevotella sp.]|nr:hypothetical protein [Alloprevotella sp.]